MKKIFVLITALCMAASVLSGCNTDKAKKGDEEVIEQNPSPENQNDTDDGVKDENPAENPEDKPEEKPLSEGEKALEETRKMLADEDVLFGVAYLGIHTGEYSEVVCALEEMGLFELYPFLSESGEEYFFEGGSEELYAVFPKDKDCVINIYDAALDDEGFALEKTKLIGTVTDGMPFIFRGRSTEFLPNVIFDISCSEIESFEYSPCLSGMDGRLIPYGSVYDMTPYELIAEYFDLEWDGGEADIGDAAWCGMWTCRTKDSTGYDLLLFLDLYNDGSASYSYGPPESELFEYFFGSWSYDAESDLILLDLFGGPVVYDGEEVPEGYEPYPIKPAFAWEMDYSEEDTCLILNHVSGDPILYGEDKSSFRFYRFGDPCYDCSFDDYTFMIGSWAIFSEKVEIFLELFDDGTAHYSFADEDGTLELDGFWSASEQVLYLDLYEYRENNLTGEEPAVYYGEYGIEYGIYYDSEILNLSLLEGFALTNNMKDNGYDEFVLYAVG